MHYSWARVGKNEHRSNAISLPLYQYEKSVFHPETKSLVIMASLISLKGCAQDENILYFSGSKSKLQVGKGKVSEGQEEKSFHFTFPCNKKFLHE